jgi:hypothetical protein
MIVEDSVTVLQIISVVLWTRDGGSSMSHTVVSMAAKVVEVEVMVAVTAGTLM